MDKVGKPSDAALKEKGKSVSLLMNKLGARAHWSRAAPPPPPAAVRPDPVALHKEISLKRVCSLPLHFDQKPIKDLEIAKTIVEDAIGSAFDQNNHCIDLSNSGLTVVPTSIFDLKCFTPVNSQRNFCNLHIFLNNNFLAELPAEMFDLEKIGLLSLRSNQLEEIPSDIYKLKNLEELSLSANRLRYLPAEISRLEKLRTISVNQNPFFSDEEIAQFNSEAKINMIDLKELCIRVIALHFPEFLKKRGICMYRCSNCYQLLSTHYSAFIRKESICSSVPVAIMYRSCSAKCHEELQK